MKKKFLNFMLFGAFTFALSSSFVGCSSDDYDDDIKNLQEQIDKLKTDLTGLQAATGTFVKSVTYNEATGELTVETASGSNKINLGKNAVVKYTLEVDASGKITLKGDDGSTSTANIQFPAGTFDPTKLTANANGEVLYDGVKTGVTIPASSSAASMVEIKEGDVVVGYTIKIGDQSADFFINDALPLKSIVFEPGSYLGGVEAMKARTVEYGIWTKFKDYESTPNPQYPYGKIEWWNAPGTGTGYITPDIVAYYHLNPASVTVEQIESLAFRSDDKEYVSKTRAAAFNPVATSYEVENGMLKVKIKFAGEKIEAIDSDLISVLALQVTTKEGEEIVTSDYAAVYKTVINDLTLSFKEKGLPPHRPHLWGAYEDGRKDAANITLKGKAEDAIWDYVAAVEREADYEVLYNDQDGIDLKERVEIHYNEWRDVARPFQPADRIGDEHKILTATEMADLGLSLNYEISNYWAGTNKTEMKDFATITTDGVLKAKLFNTGVEDPMAAVGRMPLVRVELKHGNNVINAGWIKVKIVKDESKPQTWGKEFNYIKPDCAGVKLLTTVEEMNTQIYQKAGLSKEDFEAIYKLQVDGSGNAIPQNTDFAGTVKEVVNQGSNTHTTLLEWTLPAAQVWLDADGKFEITVRYAVASDPNRTFDVTFTTSTVKPTATYNNKIAEYWYDNKTAIEVNAIVPATMSDDADINTDIDNVFTLNKPGFTINWPNVQFENATTSFDAANLTYSYYFVDPATVRTDYASMGDANYGRDVVGNDGNKYTLGTITNADGSFLTATSGATTQLIAYMNPATGVVTYNNEYVLGADYRTGYTLPERPWLTPANIVPAGISTADIYAKALLNKDARNSGNEFYAWVGVELVNGCNMAFASNEIFKSKYLRPVNVAETTTKVFEDGVDGGSTIKMLDLVQLSDWRNAKFADNLPYYNYYGVKSITIDAANITTNLNGGNINSTLLTSITSNIVITPAYVSDPVTPNYGTVTYTNNGNTVGTFKLRIPVNVEYLWGTVKTYIIVDVKQTVG